MSKKRYKGNKKCSRTKIVTKRTKQVTKGTKNVGEQKMLQKDQNCSMCGLVEPVVVLNGIMVLNGFMVFYGLLMVPNGLFIRVTLFYKKSKANLGNVIFPFLKP